MRSGCIKAYPEIGDDRKKLKSSICIEQNTEAEHLNNRMPCGFCRNLGLSNAIVNSHFVKNCGELAKHECQKCGRLGHTQSRCSNVPLISFARKNTQPKPRAPVRVVRPDAPLIVNAPAKPVVKIGAWSAGAPKPAAAASPAPTKKPVVESKKMVMFASRVEAIEWYENERRWEKDYLARENELRKRVQACGYSSGLWSDDPECY